MDFDKSHGYKFASFEAFPDEIALVFNKHEDTVRNWHNGLLSKGFIKVVDEKRNLYTVKSPLRYVVGLNQWGGEASKFAGEETNQTQEFILENVRFSPLKSENILPNSDALALKSSNFNENSLSSSKGKSIVSSSIGSRKVVVIRQAVRNDAEYQRMYEASDLNLSIDDMKWIDQNVVERIEIESDEQEKEIVRIYFDGNWDEYQKNLLISYEIKR
jgi:hypothetical protein